MEEALRWLQPACVLCGADDCLSTDHVRPLSKGFGLEPGNAVTLCISCNSTKHDKDLDELPPDVAMKLLAEAKRFRDRWLADCG
jgi:5-methylcytosine-specific restriction endonuclease McrA